MAVTDFYNLINLDVFASVLGLGVFAWASGYGLGYILGFTRRVAYTAAN